MISKDNMNVKNDVEIEWRQHFITGAVPTEITGVAHNGEIYILKSLNLCAHKLQ